MAKKKETREYVNNKEFYQAMIEWKILVKEAENTDESRPPITEYIGECFLKIAEHLSYRPNFMNYPYREEMIGDGIENCLLYAHNFDPDKSKNPFSYFTQIIYYAFLRRIEKEKKQSYIKYKYIQEKDKERILTNYYRENYFDNKEKEDKEILLEHFNLNNNDVKKFTPKKKKNSNKKGTLDSVLEDEKNEDSTDK
jgi:hypothetical protein